MNKRLVSFSHEFKIFGNWGSGPCVRDHEFKIFGNWGSGPCVRDHFLESGPRSLELVNNLQFNIEGNFSERVRCQNPHLKSRESKFETHGTETGKMYLLLAVSDFELFGLPKLFGTMFRTKVRLAPSTEQKSEVSKFSNSTENELVWTKQEERISTSSGVLRVELVVKCR